MRRYTWLFVGGGLVLVIAALLIALLGSWHTPTAQPVLASPSVASLPGDAYIDQTATRYMQTVIAGDSRAIERLRPTSVDPDAVRSESLGRFASASAASLKVVSVHDEQATSGAGSGKPATSWSAIVTVKASSGSRVETFGVQLDGTYGTNGSVDSSHADASVR